VHDFHPPPASDDDSGSSLGSSDSGRDDLPPLRLGPTSLAPWQRVYRLAGHHDSMGSPLPFLPTGGSDASWSVVEGATVGHGRSAERKMRIARQVPPQVNPWSKAILVVGRTATTSVGCSLGRASWFHPGYLRILDKSLRAQPTMKRHQSGSSSATGGLKNLGRKVVGLLP
jgi:hypothetical protein